MRGRLCRFQHGRRCRYFAKLTDLTARSTRLERKIFAECVAVLLQLLQHDRPKRRLLVKRWTRKDASLPAPITCDSGTLLRLNVFSRKTNSAIRRLLSQGGVANERRSH